MHAYTAWLSRMIVLILNACAIRRSKHAVYECIATDTQYAIQNIAAFCMAFKQGTYSKNRTDPKA